MSAPFTSPSSRRGARARVSFAGTRPLASRPVAGDRPLAWLGWSGSVALFVIPLALVVATLLLRRGAGPPAVDVAVVDRYTSAPVVGAEVTAGGMTAATDANGFVALPEDGGAVDLQVRAAGYEPVTAAIDAAQRGRWSIALRPNTLSGRLLDAEGGAPIGGARVSVVTQAGPGPSTASAADGTYRLEHVPGGARLRIESDAYGTVEEPVGEQTTLDVKMTPSIVSGVVRDASNNPIAGAKVVAANGSASAVTGPDGGYRLTGGSDVAEVVVSAAGFADQRAAVPANREVAVALEREEIKAVYANLGVLTTPERFNRLIEIADTTEINAMVVDVKQDSIYYDTKVPFFASLDDVVVPAFDPKQVLATLRAHRIYSIARMVVFKDPIVAEQRPDLAVKDEENGGLWRDTNGAAWVNAFDEELWHANADLAAELARLGFDEVQYDYIRFPSDGDLRTSDFGRDYTEEARRTAIAGAVALGAQETRAAGASFAVDLFPIIALFGNDQGIGQTLQDLAPLVDYVSLMIYPSHYALGNIPVDGHPNDFPAETVSYTLEAAERLVPGSKLKMRPWLQDFTYPMEGFSAYGPTQVRAQIDAAESFGTSGWMLWNAAGDFQVDALKPQS